MQKYFIEKIWELLLLLKIPKKRLIYLSVTMTLWLFEGKVQHFVQMHTEECWSKKVWYLVFASEFFREGKNERSKD